MHFGPSVPGYSLHFSKVIKNCESIKKAIQDECHSLKTLKYKKDQKHRVHRRDWFNSVWLFDLVEGSEKRIKDYFKEKNQIKSSFFIGKNKIYLLADDYEFLDNVFWFTKTKNRKVNMVMLRGYKNYQEKDINELGSIFLSLYPAIDID